jgi:hypothetical protein
VSPYVIKQASERRSPLYPQKLALFSPTSGGRSVGIVRSRTKATELVKEGKLHNEELHNFYYSPSIIRMITQGRCGHVARMCEKRNVYSLLV